MAVTKPYATPEQYMARYGAVADTAALTECLMDVTDAIDAAYERAHCAEPPVGADRLMRVCRQIAHRVMPSEASILDGAASQSVTMGPFSRQVTFPTPYGSIRLRADELAALGIRSVGFGYVWPR